MNMKFRYHKATLADSLKTTIEINTKEALFEILKKDLNAFGFKLNIKDIKCIPYGFDERINWNTYLVTIKDYGVIGMTNQKI